MNRAAIILFAALLGLGLGLALAGHLRHRREGPVREETQPWRMLSPGAIGAAFAAATLLAVGVLALAGPILALAAGILIFEIAFLVLQALKAKRESRVRDEAMVLADTLATEMTLGSPLPDALRGYARRHPKASLADEIQRFILAPLAGGEALVSILNTLAGGDRYRAYPNFHRLLQELARAVRARLTPEEMEYTLRTYLDTAEMIDEVRRELAVDVTQTRYTRWAVIGIIGGAVFFMASAMPGAREHWLHDLPGQLTMLLVSLFTALAIGLGERLARVKEWRF